MALSDPTTTETASDAAAPGADDGMTETVSVTHPDLPGKTFVSRNECRQALDDTALADALTAALATQNAYASPGGARAAAERLSGVMFELIEWGVLTLVSRDSARAYATEASGRALPPREKPATGDTTTNPED